MNDEDRQLWQNFSDALWRLLEHPDLTQAQRDFILQNLEEDETGNVIDIRSKRDRKK
ncbi:hypothetical protein [Raoultella terrigena]|uniref:hypothetical protein n=1 Tax=Raoultella terrigena TaxID=577 RepID=UPI00161DCE83|nr:hypothetical protein [Raoultella terrigena]